MGDLDRSSGGFEYSRVMKKERCQLAVKEESEMGSRYSSWYVKRKNSQGWGNWNRFGDQEEAMERVSLQHRFLVMATHQITTSLWQSQNLSLGQPQETREGCL